MLWVSSVLLLLAGLTCAEEPRKCCFDKEFTTVLGEVGGKIVHGHAEKIEGNVQLAFDYYRARQGSINTIMQDDGSYRTTYVLDDFTKRISYSRVENNTCIARQMTPEEQMYPPCVPDDATYAGTYTIGYGTEAIEVHSWNFMLPQTTIRVKLSVTQHCVPFSQALFGPIGGTDEELTMFFTSYHPGIDPSVDLSIPTDCTFTSRTGGNMVGRRSIRFF